MGLRRLTIFVLLSAGCFSLATASPTSNEFEVCSKTSSALLLACLNESINGVNDQCWDESKLNYNDCRERVIKSHQLDKERIEQIKGLGRLVQ